MAKTVGVPCGITTQLILDGMALIFFIFQFFCVVHSKSISKLLRIPGKISDKGVLAPYAPHVYEPIVELLEKENVKVVDEILDL